MGGIPLLHLSFPLSCLAMILTDLGMFPNKRLGYRNKSQSMGELVSEENKRTFNTEQPATTFHLG